MKNFLRLALSPVVHPSIFTLSNKSLFTFHYFCYYNDYIVRLNLTRLRFYFEIIVRDKVRPIKNSWRHVLFICWIWLILANLMNIAICRWYSLIDRKCLKLRNETDFLRRTLLENNFVKIKIFEWWTIATNWFILVLNFY